LKTSSANATTRRLAVMNLAQRGIEADLVPRPALLRHADSRGPLVPCENKTTDAKRQDLPELGLAV